MSKRALWYWGWAITKGGPGSGNWGHAGRPGQRGGSVPKSFAMSLATGPTAEARQQEAAGKPKGLAAPKFKSTKEAEQWVEAQGLISGRCFFKGFDLDVAQQTVDSLVGNIERVPQLKGQIKFMGNNRELSKMRRDLARPGIKEDLKKWALSPDREKKMVDSILRRRPYTLRMMPRAYAMAVGNRDFYVSHKWAKDGAAFRRSLESDAKAGWHPPGMATPKAVIDHEISHVLEGVLRLGRDAPLNDMVQTARRNRDYPSQYARKNFSEFIAESWSEYLNSGSPGATSERIGRRIEEIAKKGVQTRW